MQYLPRGTATDVALALSGAHPVEVEIDRRKHSFSEQFCDMPSHLQVKELSTHRLLHYNENSVRQLGFIPDIYRLLGKYPTDKCPRIILGGFIPKFAWRCLLHEKLSVICTEESLRKISTSESLSRFILIHCRYCPYNMYQISKEMQKCIRTTKKAVRLLGLMFNFQTRLAGSACGVMRSALTEHILYCKENEIFRTKLW